MVKDILRQKSLDYAGRIVKLSEYLIDAHKQYVLSKQILRSGTSIGACVREAANAESKFDMIHKFAIAQKEADETLYWLELLHLSDYLEEKLYKSLFSDCEELLKILKASIVTLKKSVRK